MIEQWEKWEPLIGIPSTLYVDRLVDDINGFLIEMTSEDEKIIIRVRFETVFAYRNGEEGGRIKTVHSLVETYGKDFFAECSLFKVKQSDFLNWFVEESYGMYNKLKIEHYAFLTANDVVDVLSVCPPNVSIHDKISKEL